MELARDRRGPERRHPGHLAGARPRRAGRRFHLARRCALGLHRRVSGAGLPDDIALVLHTSGTTSRPKIVPLPQINVTASAYHIGETLALTPEDVCLNIMPLFHIHGLIAATLSSLAAGAAVSCTPGFNAFRFFAWFDEVRPTWYTAVPTMHQAILGLAARNTEIIARRPPALHPLVLGLAAAAGDGGAGGLFGVPVHRVLRHDRGGASDGLQPAAAARRVIPARSASRRVRRSPSWTTDGNILPPANWARW